MLHTIIQGEQCVQIQYDHGSIIINPQVDNPALLKRLHTPIHGVFFTQHFASHISIEKVHALFPEAPILMYTDVLDAGLLASIRVQAFAIDGVGFDYVFSTGNTHIYYQEAPFVPGDWYHTILATYSPIDAGLFDISIGNQQALELAGLLRPRVAVPIHVTTQTDPIAFCRDIMLYNTAVPKYLTYGQYVVHGI